MRPVLVYDSACEFCRRWVQRWQARTGDRVAYRPLQPRLLKRFGIPRSEALRAVQLVMPDGKRYRGADAVFRTLGYAPETRTLARIGRLPGLRHVAELVYRQIAKHRSLAAVIDRWLFGRSTGPSDMRRVRDLFMRALGGVYLITFSSLRRQLAGLYGSRGIRPIDELLRIVRTRLPRRERLRAYPTIFWLGSSDEALALACLGGELGAILLMLGIRPRATAAALWLLYLSFVSVGREFLGYQWDALLLENGLHSIVVAPGRAGDRPPWSAVALMRWLAFRLQFESGHAKLESGDPTWRNGNACCVHFETQPLPTRYGWYAHQAPRLLKHAATYTALGIELGAPWLAFAPRRLRHASFGLLAGLQVLIALTGNYGFFNALTIVDDLWLLDDSVLPRPRARGERPSWWRRLATAATALPLGVMAISLLAARLFPRARMPRPVERMHEAVGPLRSMNSYGLFAVMTTDRPEIVIEGSDDGVTWHEYEFRYKPGDVTRAPRWVAPHQPRLDWQMWFAALGPAPAWFMQLLQRLLEGSPPVLALFETNPFPQHPPRYVRALLYDYHMTDHATRKRTGAWWRRELLGTYVVPVALAHAS